MHVYVRVAANCHKSPGLSKAFAAVHAGAALPFPPPAKAAIMRAERETHAALA